MTQLRERARREFCSAGFQPASLRGNRTNLNRRLEAGATGYQAQNYWRFILATHRSN